MKNSRTGKFYRVEGILKRRKIGRKMERMKEESELKMGKSKSREIEGRRKDSPTGKSWRKRGRREKAEECLRLKKE